MIYNTYKWRKKISNRETGKPAYLHRVGKMEQFSLSLYVFEFSSTKWKTFHGCHLFPRNAKKLSNFIFLYIFLFIFMKWITFHQYGLFPRSRKYFTYALYFLEKDKCLMNYIIAKQSKMIDTGAGILCVYKYEVEKN